MSDILKHVHATHEDVETEELTPPHSPREDTPTYRRAHHFLVVVKDSPCEVCGVRNSTLGDASRNRYGATAVETHHHPIERSLWNACDPVKVHKDFAGVYDQTTLEAFIDSPLNLKVLCLAGDMPVLMATGDEKPIAEVAVGEMVIGHDLAPHTVIGKTSRHVEENLIDVDGIYMTSNHPLLTQRGWVPAGAIQRGELVYHVEMVRPKVFSVVNTQFQVLNTIVGLDSVNVMNTLCASKKPAKVLLHNIPVLQNRNQLSISPHSTSSISTRYVNTMQSLNPLFGKTVQGIKTALVRTVSNVTRMNLPWSGSKICSTLLTEQRYRTCSSSSLLSPRTYIGASSISRSEIKDDLVLLSTYYTTLNNASAGLPLQTQWRAVNHISSFPYHGDVYDISVAHSSSFITKGVVVHNCNIHHRSPTLGIHHLLPQDFFCLRYLYDQYQIASAEQDAVLVEAADQAVLDHITIPIQPIPPVQPTRLKKELS